MWNLRAKKIDFVEPLR